MLNILRIIGYGILLNIEEKNKIQKGFKMKKFLAMILAFAVLALPVTPAFAKNLDDDEMEIGRHAIPIKVGYGFSQGGAAGINRDYIQRFDLEDGYIFSIGYLYYSNYDSTGIGFAVDYMPATEAKDSNGDVKVGLYNIYFTINPGLKSGNTFDFYLPLHIGFSFPFKEVKDTVTADIDCGDFGVYYGIGLGTTIKKSFVIELMYTFSGAFIDQKQKKKTDDSLFFGTNYGGIRLNIGYNFHFGKTISNKEGRFSGKE